MIAAAIAPIMALVGGGVDMGRSYLSQSRLQQACDAGVLAARKRLGSEVAVTGDVPDEVAETGQRFFNINFRDGSYGTKDRDFAMTLEEDFAISGVATVTVPTTIMHMFGFEQVPVRVECEAQINVSNTDVMMVLDVTGSMAQTNPGDSASRMETMKATIRNFYAQLASAGTTASRIRYGFVPYSTNVNVGHLLLDDWVTDSWHYQSRELKQELGSVSSTTYTRNYAYQSGTRGPETNVSSYAATYHAGSPGYTYVDARENVVVVPAQPAGYSCDGATPSGNYTRADTKTGTATEPFVAPPSGRRKIEYWKRVENGTRYWTARSGSTCYVKSQTFDAYTSTYERVTDPKQDMVNKWRYDQFTRDVSDWRTSGNGCIEERDTYEIADYAAVDLSRALDLDIDRLPTAGDAATQWRPMMPQWIFGRALKWDGSGSFTTAQKVTAEEYVSPIGLKTAACPAPARKLGEMTADELSDYLDTLSPTGSTYHDIGMIWGGRLLSPTGLFAEENAGPANANVSRHLIFLTDGETAPLDLSYSSYGFEPIDQRRWSPGSTRSLTQTVEQRFAFACSEVRKRNITVWVIGFGTTLNPVMRSCAGDDHSFEAEDADELNEAFARIAESMADLRIQR